MKILMIEATAEELSANRTVMDSINDALSTFARGIFGINSVDISNVADEEEEDD